MKVLVLSSLIAVATATGIDAEMSSLLQSKKDSVARADGVAPVLDRAADELKSLTSESNVAGGCQRVLDQCTTSQKMPLVGDLITVTFQDCVKTFSKVRSKNSQGLLQSKSEETAGDRQCSDNKVLALWRQEQDYFKGGWDDFDLELDVILVDSQDADELAELQTAFHTHSNQQDLPHCQAGLNFYDEVVDHGEHLKVRDLGIKCPSRSADGRCFTESGMLKEVWRKTETEELHNLAQAVCSCLAPSNLLQTLSGSALYAQTKVAFEMSSDYLQTVGGFYERSATAFDDFVEKFSWLPQSLTQELRMYNADRHIWAGEMAKSGRTMQTCHGVSGQSLLQNMESTMSCLRKGLSEADQASTRAVSDAKKMSEIVASWSQYVPLCGAFVQFAKNLPEMYESLQTSIKLALENAQPEKADVLANGEALIQAEADEALGLLSQRISSALDALNQGMISLSRSK